jgi:hypothetical protein
VAGVTTPNQDPSPADEPDRGIAFPGAMPPPPTGGLADRPAEPVVPREVRYSFILWIVTAVISLINGAQVVGQRDALRSAILAGEATQPGAPKLTPDQLETAVTGSIVVAIGLAVVIAGLYVLFAVKMRAGRNWARIVLTVLAALGVVVGVLGQRSVYSVLGLVCEVGGAVLMYLAPATAYFGAQRIASRMP